MPVKEILKMGDPRLLQTSTPVHENEFTGLDAIIKDMVDTMHAADGAGLAAPQIGIMKRIVIFGVDQNPRYPDAESVPFTVLINPTIHILAPDAEYGWEGCLSVPGLRGMVARYSRIRYTGLDEKGNSIDRSVTGFHARVVQHECDHLDGILYPMRIDDMQYFGFEDQLAGIAMDCPPTQILDVD